MQLFLLFKQLKTTSKAGLSFPLSALQTDLQRSQHTHMLTHTHKVDALWFNYLYLVSVWLGRGNKQCFLTHTLTRMHVHTHGHTQNTHIVPLSPWPQSKGGRETRDILRLQKVSLTLNEMVIKLPLLTATGSHLWLGCENGEQVHMRSYFKIICRFSACNILNYQDVN